MDPDDFIAYPELDDLPELKSATQNLIGLLDGGTVEPFQTAEDKLRAFRKSWTESPELAKERARSVARHLYERRSPIGADVTKIGAQVIRPKFNKDRPYE